LPIRKGGERSLYFFEKFCIQEVGGLAKKETARVGFPFKEKARGEKGKLFSVSYSTPQRADNRRKEINVSKGNPLYLFA